MQINSPSFPIIFQYSNSPKSQSASKLSCQLLRLILPFWHYPCWQTVTVRIASPVVDRSTPHTHIYLLMHERIRGTSQLVLFVVNRATMTKWNRVSPNRNNSMPAFYSRGVKAAFHRVTVIFFQIFIKIQMTRFLQNRGGGKSSSIQSFKRIKKKEEINASQSRFCRINPSPSGFMSFKARIFPDKCDLPS